MPSESPAHTLPSETSGCPFAGRSVAVVEPFSKGTSNRDWWPDRLDLSVLRPSYDGGTRDRHHPDPSFDYARAFLRLDLDAVRADLRKVMTNSQDWWPADYGHYGPFFLRMAWHSAGTYRLQDGRGGARSGQLRFAPLNSWPDNTNLDKARRLLWPVKQKYGASLSWADLMVLTGNVALEDMGFPGPPLLGFAGGRVDAWGPDEEDESRRWGHERTWLASEDGGRSGNDVKMSSQSQSPLAAVQMGLIYVNPEGPAGVPDPTASAADIRHTFGRMGMDDVETVALVAGGHTFGKCHGATASTSGPEPEAAPLEQMGLGWKGGAGATAVTSGLEGAWTYRPARWTDGNGKDGDVRDLGYLAILFGHEWELTKSPGGAQQWKPKLKSGETTSKAGVMVPDAHLPGVWHQPMMLTSDLALKVDPAYRRICLRFLQDSEAFRRAFAAAWYKLTTRDLGPYPCCLGPYVPPPQPWQDPLPSPVHPPLSPNDVARIRRVLIKCLGRGASYRGSSVFTIARMVECAWASACTYRRTDRRGGANGARIRLSPQRRWPINCEDDGSNKFVALLEAYENLSFTVGASVADLIVLGGGVAIEVAATRAGLKGVEVPFTPGRVDAPSDGTTSASSTQEVLEPTFDGFRNYLAHNSPWEETHALVERAYLLDLSAPEMTALVGGLRVLGVGVSVSTGIGCSFVDDHGGDESFTRLSNDFFRNVLDADVEWTATTTQHASGRTVYTGRDRRTGAIRWRCPATAVDLLFGSHPILRALSEAYASDRDLFVLTFVQAFAKVMNNDRFDLPSSLHSRSRL